MACSTAQPGSTVPRSSPLPYAAKSWVSPLHPTSSSTLPVSCSKNIYYILWYFLIILVTEAGPTAFATIKENYYYVFVCCTTFFLVIAYMFFPYALPCH